MHNDYHAHSVDEVLSKLQSHQQGLSLEEVQSRREQFGWNRLAIEKPPNWLTIFICQFKSPLIYILLCALIISLLIQEWSDGIFIAAVLVLNAVIGAFQEHAAEKTAQSLKQIMPNRARVLRAGESYEVKAEEVVPGDIVLLDTGGKVPADCRLISSQSLEVDESLLTGESIPVKKDAKQIVDIEMPLSDQTNMIFSGTLVTRGQAMGVVVAVGQYSQIGQIVKVKHKVKPPLVLRMEKFTHRIAYAMGVVVLFMLMMSMLRGTPLLEMFYIAVALAVSAIPEGLPVALTIALAIGMKRMASRNVVVRKLVAVEALGSCTYIGSDKTGTLTVNELTAKRVVIPSGEQFDIQGEGIDPTGAVTILNKSNEKVDNKVLTEIALTGVLTNDGSLAKRNNQWVAHGDSVDVAFLVLAHKLGVSHIPSKAQYPLVCDMPYESEKAYSAVCCQVGKEFKLYVKGAPEKLLSMCQTMMVSEQLVKIDLAQCLARLQTLAGEGFRVLAVCQSKPFSTRMDNISEERDLQNLCFLGFVGIIDPVRKEVPEAIEQCQQAGLKVSMITGDHPITAYAIANRLKLLSKPEQVMTGKELSLYAKTDQAGFDKHTRDCAVYARVSPQQKMQIIESMKRQGEFVAVTGDGVNDVPALRAAHVGVAMGKRGTDVAKESSSIILTDDNFASIVAGIEEGRIAYANVRKVIYLLISTGMAEVLLFIFALLANMPLPLLPVQLLWLNLVTNGIQDVALAFEEAEGNELNKPPRDPKEPIFNKLMLRRVVLGSFVMSTVAFLVYYILLEWNSDVTSARNMTLLLMVLFENVQAFNCRSETQSLFRRGIMGNKLLFLGVIAAQGIHIAAMYIPSLSIVLNISPVSISEWALMLLLASSLFFAVELQKILFSCKKVR